MTKEDKKVIALFDGLAYLADAITAMTEPTSAAQTYATKAHDIFRKAASEAGSEEHLNTNSKTKE